MRSGAKRSKYKKECEKAMNLEQLERVDRVGRAKRQGVRGPPNGLSVCECSEQDRVRESDEYVAQTDRAEQRAKRRGQSESLSGKREKDGHRRRRGIGIKGCLCREGGRHRLQRGIGIK